MSELPASGSAPDAHGLNFNNPNPNGLGTLAARAGETPPSANRPSVSPVYLTTAFDVESLDQLDDIIAQRTSGFIYTRDDNPNHASFAADIAALERTEAALPCASGMGALSAVLLGLLKTGDHLLAATVLYGKTSQLLRHLEQSLSIHVTFVDAADPDAWTRSRRPETKLAIVESVTNPLVAVTDIRAIADALGDVPLLVDNTFATPCLLRPVEHGATLVWHSASKYLNGHGDVMLGVIAGPEVLIRKARSAASLFGLNANPFDCWMATRGLRTLPLRVARVSQSAMQISMFLNEHPSVTRVYHPGLPTHETHSVAQRLMASGFGGMLSFELSGGRDAVDRLIRELAHCIPFSPTLADARTTLSYPAGTSHRFISAADRGAAGIGDGLVRLSVGLEEPSDLIRELGQGLARVVG